MPPPDMRKQWYLVYSVFEDEDVAASWNCTEIELGDDGPDDKAVEYENEGYSGFIVQAANEGSAILKVKTDPDEAEGVDYLP